MHFAPTYYVYYLRLIPQEQAPAHAFCLLYSVSLLTITPLRFQTAKDNFLQLEQEHV